MGPTDAQSENATDVFRAADEIDWARLRHLRGAATDIPALLRGLASDDPEARRHSLRTLGVRVLPFYDGIDGAVCEVTSYVVPFLARLAAAEVASSAELLVLLRRIASVAWDRDPFPATAKRDLTPRELLALRARALETRGTLSAALARRLLVPNEAPNARPRSRGPVLFAARATAALRDASAALFRHFDPMAAELLYGHRAHEALVACLPIFFGLLGSAREDVRTEAARLVERLAQSAARPYDLSLRILAHLEKEHDEIVLAHLVLSLGHIGDRQARTLLEALLDAQDPWVRIVAAVSLVPPPLEASSRTRLEVLVDALTVPEAISDRYEIATSRALADDVTRTLTENERDRREVGRLLLGLLAERRDREVPEAVFDVLLEVMFPDTAEPVSPTALSREQRAVLSRLQAAERSSRPRDRDLAAKLAAKGLPTDAKSLARFVQVN